MTPPPAALAVAQFAPGADADANLAAIAGLVATAVARGASLVVLPEYSSFFVPSLGPDFVAGGQSLDGAFVAALAALAREHGIHLVAGLVEARPDRADGSAVGKVSNTLVAIDPTGAIVATYRKLHLYDAFGDRESDWVVPGEVAEPETFAWAGLTVGLQTCYDIRFPEVTRRIVDAGADVVLLPAEWVRGPLKEHHWRTLVTARAIENTIYVAAADHAPPVGAGNSMVVDPMGVEVVAIGEQTDVAVAWIAADRIASTRERNPALGYRRFAIVPRPAP
ncbi:carbon-nitrogen hydrolase family protein [Galbitalea sp. SE-J8]|uniref:carbon-nitrogen hydrolase family protein n=1 Tax=Galbitalea sp. SE-J8 TaxID=3054952 RepID=UPI00259D07D5|nr:carbon-nitrogen hydrolase family protein [Galbitalea sp. SE-J8]MDM4763535.1 carbon-nitrogen hydrolase family protein [Galbitalea sp. SE-J8]